MGVPQIWELLRNHVGPLDSVSNPHYKRVVFKKFLAREKPVIAIDAYHILFECGFFQFEFMGKPVLNLLRRLKELVALDVSFVLVFDGLEKPPEKNQSTGSTGANLNSFSPQCIVLVKSLLQLLGISMVQARGEGEVQCCWFQSRGMADLVWSNDSDCLLFGGDKILKNYSRQIRDVGVSSSAKQSGSPGDGPSGRESFATVLDYKELLAASLLSSSRSQLLDQNGLVFYSVLLGADYNSQGVKGLGKDKSFKLATLRNPNFAQQFCHIFTEASLSSFEIQAKYESFQRELYQYCQLHSVKLFGRNYSVLTSRDRDNFENWPPISVVNHYFHPILDDKLNIDDYLQRDRYINVYGSKAFDRIDFVKLKQCLLDIQLPQITDFDRWFHETIHEMFLLKFILYHEDKSVDACKITEEKIVTLENNVNFRISYWKVRYNTFLPNVKPSSNNLRSRSTSPEKHRSSSPTRSQTRRQRDIQEYKFGVWLPKDCIPESHPLVQSFHERERERVSKEISSPKKKNGKRQSPKKRFQNYKQSNTLESFLSAHSSPIKREASSLSQIKHSEGTKLARPMGVTPRRLFVEESPGDNTDSTDGEGNDSSLIIIDEKPVVTPARNVIVSPKRELFDVDSESELESNAYKRHSPAKKQGSTKPTVLNLEAVKLTPQPSEATMAVSPPLGPGRVSLDKPAPLLARMDTFARKKEHSTGSILDRLAMEGEEHWFELEDSDSSFSGTSTVGTLE